MLSVIEALQGHYWNAGWLILLAIIFDGLDGKIAKLTKTTSDFGEEYDSLCDLISFGVAPAVLMYQVVMVPFEGFGFPLVIIFVLCTAIRLARFNVQSDTIENGYFSGIPSPTAGGTLAAAVLCMVKYNLLVMPDLLRTAILFFILFLSVMMVSKVPYYNFKKIHWEKREPFHYLVIVVLLIGTILMNPPLALFGLFIFYITSGLILHLLHRTKLDEETDYAEDTT